MVLVLEEDMDHCCEAVDPRADLKLTTACSMQQYLLLSGDYFGGGSSVPTSDMQCFSPSSHLYPAWIAKMTYDSTCQLKEGLALQ